MRLRNYTKNGLKVAAPAVMCSLVRTLGRGGAMKNPQYACYCYNVHGDSISKPNAQLYEDCVADGSMVCYHHEVSDEALLRCLQTEKDDCSGPIYRMYLIKNHL